MVKSVRVTIPEAASTSRISVPSETLPEVTPQPVLISVAVVKVTRVLGVALLIPVLTNGALYRTFNEPASTSSETKVLPNTSS